MPKFPVFFSLIFAAAHAFGQVEHPPAFALGFQIGYENQKLDWLPNRPADPNAPPKAWADRPSFGFGFGAVANWRLFSTVEFRLEPGLAVTRNHLHFRATDNSISDVTYSFSDLELPAHLVFTNAGHGFPLRGSFLVGGRFSWNLAGRPDGGALVLFPYRFGVDLGLGVDFHLKKLRLRPELLYSFGLPNLNDLTATPPSLGIGSVVRDRLSFRVLVFP